MIDNTLADMISLVITVLAIIGFFLALGYLAVQLLKRDKDGGEE